MEETPVIWESTCQGCGGAVLTDEWVGNEPYFGKCQECGGEVADTWRVSDELHPALWQ